MPREGAGQIYRFMKCQCEIEPYIAIGGQLNICNNLSDYISFSDTVTRICNGAYKSEYERYVDYKDGFSSLVGYMKYFHNEINQITIYLDNQLVEYEECILPATSIKTEPWYQEIEKSNAINWMALEEGKENISKITLAMSSFYRTALNKGNNLILQPIVENAIEHGVDLKTDGTGSC